LKITGSRDAIKSGFRASAPNLRASKPGEATRGTWKIYGGAEEGGI